MTAAGAGAPLAGLERRRAEDCRLEPDRALRSLDEAEAFLHERGMLTRTPDSALPSLFGACHERPYHSGRGGFAQWPATKYPWFWELAARDDVYELSVHDGSRLLLTAATAALADPLCRAELEQRQAADDDPGRLLRHLGEAGPSDLADLKVELGWGPSRLRAARRPLERAGAVVSHSVTTGTASGGHLHSSLLVRWDQAYPKPASGGGLGELVAAGVFAAVLAPEPELERWFTWRGRWDERLVDDLVAGGKLSRPAPGWVAAG